MFKVLSTLHRARVAEVEECLIDLNTTTLLDQKVRDCEAGLRAAKLNLAGLIQRDRAAGRQLGEIDARIEDLTERAKAALAAEDTDRLETAATVIADLEEERKARASSKTELEAKIERLRASVQRAHRRLADLRQSAATARAADRERRSSARLGRAPSTDFAEAEALVTRILGQDDPFETDEILSGIEDDLSGRSTLNDLEAAGYGPALRTTAADVIGRLTSKGD